MRSTAKTTPTEEWWQWNGLDVHLDRLAVPESTVKVIVLHGVSLGVLVFYGLQYPSALGFILVFNALTDLADLSAISMPLAPRQGIDRAALRSAAFAFLGASGWLVVFSQVSC